MKKGHVSNHKLDTQKEKCPYGPTKLIPETITPLTSYCMRPKYGSFATLDDVSGVRMEVWSKTHESALFW